MESLLKEITIERTGDTLDKELQKRANFKQRQAEWRDAANKFDKMFQMTKEQWLAFDDIEDMFLKYNFVCVEAAYELGYTDGISVGAEQKLEGSKSVLSLEDMTTLVSVYDSFRQLKKVILGRMDEHWEDAGVFKVFEHIYDVIDNAASAEIKLLGEDEACIRISSILSNDKMSAEERAKKLLRLS